MTVQDALLQGTRLLEDGAVPVPRLTAEVLLSHAIRCDRSWLYGHATDELREVWWIHYGRYLHERLQGKPTQYITHKQEFYGREFYVSKDVLIPRPETEHVIERSLEVYKGGPIVDAGTGSGAIAITLQLETQARVIATDISAAALVVAQRNATALESSAQFLCCDLLSAVASESCTLVASNPPYVPEVDKTVLQREVVNYEPHVALFGGPDGFAIYARLIADALRVLQPGGWLVMETAYNAEERVRGMLESWSEITLTRDLAGLPRVISARKP